MLYMHAGFFVLLFLLQKKKKKTGKISSLCVFLFLLNSMLFDEKNNMDMAMHA